MNKIKNNFFVFLLVFFLTSCSFDNKSGIWKNENKTSQKKISKGVFSEFKKLSSDNNNFNKIILLDKNFKFQLTKATENKNWKDIFFSKNNNLKNFKYSNEFKLIYKSRKISKYDINQNLLYENDNFITSDTNGNLLIYSVENNNILQKFNFYKKKYKNIKKKLNIIVEENIVYVSDNLGFLYAYDYEKNKIIWAKNFKIPFRSNLKIIEDKLAAANQNNNLYIIDKNSGDNLKLIPTEETIIKNDFINNLSADEENLYFLNTYGSLYSIEIDSKKINWFINLNQSIELNPSNLFFGNQIVIENNKLVVSSNNFTYILDTNNGSIIYKKNFSSLIKPIINNDYLFLISKNNLLISMNLRNGKILFSHDLNDEIANFLGSKKKVAKFKNIAVINDGLLIFLKNSYALQLSIDGKIQKIIKLPSKINTLPIFVKNQILFADSNNKIAVMN